ncbi:MAG: hypothetical protein NBV63_01075 [Candidatus Pacebacteria bacterium]|nr:hypothetical protein [Candidatus Paceibacterota bacterium]
MDASRTQKFKAALAKVGTYHDGLGKKVDPGIKKTVALLNLLGFETVMSCAGHMRPDHGTLTPWIDVLIENKKKEEKFRTLVRSYWQDSKSWARQQVTSLFIDDYALKTDRSALRLESGMDILTNIKRDKKRIPEAVREWFYKEGTKEMRHFTEYLQDVFEGKKKPSKKAPKGRQSD